MCKSIYYINLLIYMSPAHLCFVWFYLLPEPRFKPPMLSLLSPTLLALPNSVAWHRCAKFNEHIVSETHICVGDTHTNINTLEFPLNDELSNHVNFEFRYGFYITLCPKKAKKT